MFVEMIKDKIMKNVMMVILEMEMDVLINV